MPIPLKDVEELRNHRPALAALGYETLEQFINSSRVAGRELGNYLRTDLAQLIKRLPPPTPVAPDVQDIIAKADYPLGASINYLPVPDTAAEVTFRGEALPHHVNMIPDLPPVRHQGKRGTCVAHATLAVFEHYLIRRGAYQELSEQFLHWVCKDSAVADGIPEDGTLLQQAFPNLYFIGCCLEATWPYRKEPTPPPWGQGPPPPGAEAQAGQFKIPATKRLIPKAVLDIKAELAKGRCVAISIPAFKSWYGDAANRPEEVIRTGNIVMPTPGEKPVGGHSVCVVGYEDLPDRPELLLGRFIIRNSWGENWGLECPFGVGYGTVSYRFIDGYCSEAYSIRFNI